MQANRVFAEIVYSMGDGLSEQTRRILSERSRQIENDVCSILNLADDSDPLRDRNSPWYVKPDKWTPAMDDAEWQASFVTWGLGLKRELKGFVDGWIGSAKSGGTEKPWKRIVPTDAWEAWKETHLPESILTRDGRPSIAYRMPRDRWGDRDFETKAYAVWTFMKLMASLKRERLCQCDTCGRYFERRRMPKKETVIKHGSFCEGCIGKGRAQSTMRGRERRKRELVAMAAGLWQQYPEAKRHSERSEWVAGQMNRKRPKRLAPISKKWVTQNRAAIEDAVRALSMASGVPNEKESDGRER